MAQQAESARTEETFDFVVIGSGGGAMAASLAMRDWGKQVVILEKTEKVGGSTSMSGGILWVPCNSLLAKSRISDDYEMARRYLDAVVGEGAPGATPERKDMFLRAGPRLIDYLRDKGIPFLHCDGWSDYRDELPGGMARGRSLGVKLYDIRRLGPWKDRIRRGPYPFPLEGNEAMRLTLAKRTLDGFQLAIRVGLRMVLIRLLGREMVGTGAALQSRMLEKVLDAGVDVRTDTPVTGFVLDEDGRVTGVRIKDGDTERRIMARDGVLINAGGFAHNEAMRKQWGPQPSSVQWTASNPGDTGEMIQAAIDLGADVAQMDEAVWLATSLPPGVARAAIHANELGKPHLIVVDQQGRRFTNEAGSYMETGQNMYKAKAVPCWAIMESRHRARYNWAKMPPGVRPPEWVSSGYMKKADTIEELAEQCNIDPQVLRETVDRFNGYVDNGRDLDFHRGDRAYDRYWGDPTYKPNPNLGKIERGPFFAVQLYPGDVGTFGGVVTDEFARVLRKDGSVIAGLYATGNSTASVMGHGYPGAGASIAASFVFGWVAAHHASGKTIDV